MAAGTVKMFRIELARTKRMFECPADTTVLTAARQAGLRLPSACTKGMCGTCKSKLVAGTVDLKHSGGIRPREIEAGLTLLCCAKPTSDLVIDR
jgi:ferredoxin